MDEKPFCREIICINIGQAGVQLSNAAWELFCIEHGIQASGKLNDSLEDRSEFGFATFFEEIRGNQYVPRCVSVDLEPTVLDEVRNGPYRNLFHPDQLISGFEDAANNFARGYYTIGKMLIDQVMERVRKISNNCEILQGFIIINSYGGGSGSGFTSLLFNKMAVEYAKRTKFQVAIYPGTQLATAVVEPYNTLMAMHKTKDLTDVTVLMDNESIYDICGLALDISRPTFNNLNRLIAQVFSSVTASLRFENSLNTDITQMVTNLVPFPVIHFPLANYAPILSQSRAEHQDMSTREITRALFEPFCQMVRCNVTIGRYMSCCLQYRGDVSPRDTNEAVFEIKRRTDIQFVDWCPTGFKLSICCQPPVSVVGSEMAQTMRSVTMLANSSAITQVFGEINRKFDVLFAKRAFVHWYVGEGLEEGEFSEVREQIILLEKDYEEITKIPDDDEEESMATKSNVKEAPQEIEDNKNEENADENAEENAEEEDNEKEEEDDDEEEEDEDEEEEEREEEEANDNDENATSENSLDFEDLF